MAKILLDYLNLKYIFPISNYEFRGNRRRINPELCLGRLQTATDEQTNNK